MTKIKVELGKNNKMYEFHSGPVKVNVTFTFNDQKEIVETNAYVKQEPGDIRYEIIQVRYCDKNDNRNLEVIIKQIKDSNKDESKLSGGTKFDLRKDNVDGVKVTFILGENIDIKDECYTQNLNQPEVKNGNIFTIK